MCGELCVLYVFHNSGSAGPVLLIKAEVTSVFNGEIISLMSKISCEVKTEVFDIFDQVENNWQN